MSNANMVYEVNGEKLNTTQLREKIKEVIGDKKLYISEIEAALNLPPKKLQNVIPTMAANYIVLIDTVRDSKRYVRYYNHPKSLLQEIYHPLPKGYAEMKGKVYKEVHTKHNKTMRTPYETFNFSSIYSLAE